MIAGIVDFESERITWSFDAVYADICQTRPFLVDELASNPNLSVIELQEEMESGLHGFYDVWGNTFQIVEHRRKRRNFNPPIFLRPRWRFGIRRQ